MTLSVTGTPANARLDNWEQLHRNRYAKAQKPSLKCICTQLDCGCIRANSCTYHTRGVHCPKHKERRKARHYHAELGRLFEAIPANYRKIAGKWPVDWLRLIRRCPGVTRRHVVHGCDRLSYEPFSCDFPLCPHCQHRRSWHWRESLEWLISRGMVKNPKLHTLTVPNIPELGSAMGDVMKAFTRLRRRKVYSGVEGGVRSVEVTLNNHCNCRERHENGYCWHPHLHSLVDSDWIAQYPVWDIRRVGDRWEVVEKHAGLAREWTQICQDYDSLRSQREDFDLDDPEHWYFVDMRKADRRAVNEVAKYVTKGSQIVKGGLDRVEEYLDAVRGRRLLETFGSLYNVGVDSKHGEVEVNEKKQKDHPRAGECPYNDCPRPNIHEWSYIQHGAPEDVRMVFNPSTLSYVFIDDS